MTEKNLVKGNNYDEKFASVNATLRHMHNKTWKNIFASIPPVPYSQYMSLAKIGTTIFAYMFPLKGSITKVYFLMDDTEVKSVDVVMTLRSGKTETLTTMTTRPGKNTIDVDLKVKEFDCLSCHIESAIPAVKDAAIGDILGIWSSLMVVIETPVVKVNVNVEEVA